MPLELQTKRDALGMRACDLAMEICRRYCLHAPISPDGYSEIACGGFLIRQTTPFTRRKVGCRLTGQRNGVPTPAGYYELQIELSGQRVLEASWNADERNRHISWHVQHADFIWEQQFFCELNSVLSEGEPMSRKVRKQELRRLAAVAKQQQGFSIKDVGGPGIAPGARLFAQKGLIKTQIAVRTSDDRKVGLTRTKNGAWRTIPKVDEVLVAAVASDDPRWVEVFCFESAVLLRAFDRCLKHQAELRGNRNHGYPPVFISLDPIKDDKKFFKSNLGREAKWARRLPLTLDGSVDTSTTTLADFMERTRRDYAAIVGADVADVVVEFRLTGRGSARK